MTATPLSTPLRRNLPHVLWLLLVVVIFAISASWLDPALGWPMYAVDGAHLGLVAINILPFVLIVLLLGALTRRVVLSSWIGLLLLIASHAANTAKLQQLEMPLLPGDFHFLEEIGSALPLFVHYIGTSLQPVLIALVYGAFLVSPPVAANPMEAYTKSCAKTCGSDRSAGFCQSFCSCTLDSLVNENMFADLNRGAIDVTTDERITRMSSQCTAAAEATTDLKE